MRGLVGVGDREMSVPKPVAFLEKNGKIVCGRGLHSSSNLQGCGREASCGIEGLQDQCV